MRDHRGHPRVPELAGAAGAPLPPWAGLLASHCRQFFTRYHPAVLPADPLALAAALRLPFTPFAWAVLTADAAGRISERRGGRAVLLSQDIDYPAFARWL